MKKNKKKNKVTIVILALLLLIMAAGTTFALWQLTLKQTGTNIITSGCFNLILTEDTNAINLQEAYPITNEEGKKLEPYTFTIENTCEKEAGYIMNLEVLPPDPESNTAIKVLPDAYLRASLINGSNELFFDILSDDYYLTEEKVIENSISAYKIHEGVLKGKESKQFSLRIWMDENTPATDEVMNATWQGKITIVTGLADYNLPIVQNLSSDEDAFWNPQYREKISKIIIENNVHEINNAVESWNISEDLTNENKKVMAYLVSDPTSTEGLYTLYLQGNGGIKANEDSTTFFGGFTLLETIEGLEYFDTSDVVNMWAMFASCSNLKNLDLSSFNTSKVADISLMFNMCNSLTSLNLNGIDLSQVTSMTSLFNDCYNLTTTIEITNPNIIDYENMLSNAATNESSQIILNYTTETSSLVDQIVATKSENSNIVKGTLIS